MEVNLISRVVALCKKLTSYSTVPHENWHHITTCSMHGEMNAKCGSPCSKWLLMLFIKALQMTVINQKENIDCYAKLWESTSSPQ